MKKSLTMKTLYRSLGKTVVTFLLITAVTFAMCSQIAEFAITRREFQRAADMYFGVGTVEAEPASQAAKMSGYSIYLMADSRVSDKSSEIRYKPLTKEQIDTISSMDYIDSVDIRYMTPGISEKYYRMDDGGNFYNYGARCIIEGTVTEVIPGIILSGQGSEVSSPGSENTTSILLENCKLIAGNVPWEIDREAHTVVGPPIMSEEIENYGIFYTCGLYGNRVIDNYRLDNEFSKSVLELKPGSRYAFVCRFEPFYSPERGYSPKHYIGDSLTNDWCDAFWLIDSMPENYLDMEEFTPLRELAEIIDSDIHTFDMVYTKNTGSIKRFADGSMVITDGRGITPEDSENNSPVCVVSDSFAKTNDLKVGDTLEFKLGTELFEQYKSIGAQAVTHERYSKADTPVCLEIVGIYANTDDDTNEAMEPNWSYSSSTVFLPVSFLPTDAPEGYMYSPAEFSFTVQSCNISDFIEKTAPNIKAMDLSLVFNDGGWTDIETAFKDTEKLATARILILAVAMMLADGFTAYLFINRKKKDYGIMRALGTMKKNAGRAIAIPFLCLSLFSVIIGVASTNVFLTFVMRENRVLNILCENTQNMSIPVYVAALCILVEILFIIIVSTVMLYRMGKCPPLMILQDKSLKKHKKTQAFSRKEPTSQETTVKTNNVLDAVVTKPIPKNKNANIRKRSAFSLRYALRHIQRAAFRSVLSAVVAGIMLAAVGQYSLVCHSYEALCEGTVVEAHFIGGLTLSEAKALAEEEYIANLYYGGNIPSYINDLSVNVALTNDISRYIGEKADIKFAPGYDEQCQAELGNTVILGREIMDMLGLKLGDKVFLISDDMREIFYSKYSNEYSSNNPGTMLTIDEIIAIYKDQYIEMQEEYIVAGVITTPSGNFGNTVFLSGRNAIDSSFGLTVKTDITEVNLSDYRCLGKLRDYGQRIVDTNIEVSFVLDAEKLEPPLKALTTLIKLYPAIIAAALVIGGFLCCLVILQSMKETAIMRIQGTSKRKVLSISLLEQIILCFIGLIIGACVLLICNRAAMLAIIRNIGIFAGLYFAVIIIMTAVSSTAATRKNVLELLQTKE